jgi:hypothetical protein
VSDRVAVLRTVWVGALLCTVGPAAAAGQSPLETVVERARASWIAHEARALVEQSDTVRLWIPGLAASAAVRPGQAARLLADFLAEAEETEFALREIRHVGDDHAYAEFGRRFTVRGTADVREETVFLGFRRVDGVWRLREVRVTP